MGQTDVQTYGQHQQMMGNPSRKDGPIIKLLNYPKNFVHIKIIDIIASTKI